MPISHLRAGNLLIETDHLFCVAKPSSKFPATRRIGVKGKVLDTPRKSCLKYLNGRGPTVPVDRINRIVSIGESPSAPTYACNVVGNDIFSCFSNDASKHKIRVGSAFGSSPRRPSNRQPCSLARR